MPCGLQPLMSEEVDSDSPLSGIRLAHMTRISQRNVSSCEGGRGLNMLVQIFWDLLQEEESFQEGLGEGDEGGRELVEQA